MARNKLSPGRAIALACAPRPAWSGRHSSPALGPVSGRLLASGRRRTDHRSMDLA
jgi:hypothetical protein